MLDDRRLVIPERPGNKRFDGMKNLLTNPHIGLIFLVPGREETLRVNGRAWITKDPDLLARCVAQGKTPQLAIGVEVEQCFLHCVKAFRRSKLWAHAEWPAPDALASMAQVLFDQIQPEGLTVQDYACEMEERNQKQLYLKRHNRTAVELTLFGSCRPCVIRCGSRCEPWRSQSPRSSPSTGSSSRDEECGMAACPNHQAR